MPNTAPRNFPRIGWHEVSQPAVDNDLFLSVHQRLVDKVPELGVSSPTAKRMLRTVERERGRTGLVDYERNSLEFNQAFFFRNFYKCLLVANQLALSPNFGGGLVDLGCGAGPFALAMHMSTHYSISPVLLLDRSREQLSLAKKVFSAVNSDLPTIIHDSLCTFNLPRTLFRVSSYLLCEGTWYKRPSLTKLNQLIGPSAVIIDYPEVLDVFALYLDQHGYAFLATRCVVRLTDAIKQLIRQDYVKVHFLQISSG